MPHNPLKAPSYFARMPLSARQRLLLLLVGCLGLLGYIYYKTTSEPQASFVAELSGIPIYLAPTIIAGLGLTGIIFAGPFDPDVFNDANGDMDISTDEDTGITVEAIQV